MLLYVYSGDGTTQQSANQEQLKTFELYQRKNSYRCPSQSNKFVHQGPYS